MAAKGGSGSGSSAKVVADRRARVEEMRQAQQRKERRQRLLIFGIGGVVVLAIIAVIAVAAVNRQSKKTAQILPAPIPAGAATTQAPMTSVPDTSGIAGVKAWDVGDTAKGQNGLTPTAISHDHVPGPVTYAVTPPVGGPHNQAWSNCGVYTAPIPSERAVHDLEHGAVWVTYRKSLASADVDRLHALVGSLSDATATIQGKPQSLGEKYVTMSPWADDSLPSPVVVSAWGRQLGVDKADDPRLKQFIEKFRADASLTYEVPGQCGGEPASIGGRPSS